MYTGHVGIALGAKGLKRNAPLWMLVLAAQACDWVQAAACVAAPAGESAMWSHSVPAVLLIALVLTVAGYAWTRGAGVAFVIGAVTVSHALADYLTGWKPTWPGGPMIGLDLYDRPAADLVLEAAVVAVGWLLYRRSLGAEARHGRLAWVLLAMLVGVQFLGVLTFTFFPRIPKCY